MNRRRNRQTALAMQREQKNNPNLAIVVGQTGLGQPAMMPRSMKAYIHEGMRAKTVYRVVGHIARAAAGIRWRLWQDEDEKREIKSSPLLDLWKRPAPNVSGAQFREAMIAYYCLTGNSYLLGINATGNPTRPFDELYNLRPDLTKIHVTESGPDWYEFGTFTPARRYAADQVMHNKLFAGDDDVYGLSPIEVAAMQIDRQKAANKWNLALMSNMARPGGIWTTDAILGDQEYRGLKDELRRKFAGPQNAGETAILHGGVKWQNMSMSPVELDWLASDQASDRDIAGILFNYPTFLLGLQDSTFNNQAEAKHYLYTDIIFPILDIFVDSLNTWLTPRYGGWLTYDHEDVETIAEKIQAGKAQASETVSKQWIEGTATFHETREVQGKPELPGVKDFVLIENKPVFVDQLNDYIQAQMDKAKQPPPQPLQEPTDNQPPGNEEESQKRLVGLSPLALPANRKPYRVKALNLQTVEQKAAYAKAVEAQRARWYDQAQEKIADYFQDERKTLLTAIDSVTPADAAARAKNAVDLMQQGGFLKHAIVDIWQETGTDSGQSILAQFKNQKRHRLDLQKKDDQADTTQQQEDAFNLYAPDVLIYLLSMAAKKVTQINTNTQAWIQSLLEEGVAQGESIPQLAKRIDQLYLQQIIPNRSKVIARTEVIAASNYGSQEAAKSSGLELNKVWLCTRDHRTRPDHIAADGQTVPMDEPFVVGGSKMMYPGDNSLGAAADEIIGCRCTEYYETADEDEKSLRWKMNNAHDNLGRFTSHHGASGLSAAEAVHVSGEGPIDGEHEHTVRVKLGDQDHHFTDQWTQGDVDQMLHSDHAYVIHHDGSDSQIEDIHTELRDHPDSALHHSDNGKTVLFANEELSQDQLDDLTTGLGVQVDHHVRESGDTGDYYEYANYKLLQNLADTLARKREEPSREQYRSLLKHLPGQHDQSTHGRRRTHASKHFDSLSMDEKEKFLADHGGTGWHINKMSYQEKLSLEKYTGNHYKRMNGYLRGQIPEDQAGKAVVQYCEHGQKGLLKSTAPCDMTVQRGYGHNSQVLQQFIDAANAGGNKAFFEEKGFVSTTIKDAPTFGGFRVKIKVFKGAVGGYVDPFSEHEGEKEFLLPPGAKFKVTKATKKPNGEWEFEVEYKGTNFKKKKPAKFDDLSLELKHEGDHKQDDEENGGMMSDKFVGGEGLIWGEGEEDDE